MRWKNNQSKKYHLNEYHINENDIILFVFNEAKEKEEYILEHLSNCQECQKKLDEYKILIQKLKGYKEIIKNSLLTENKTTQNKIMRVLKIATSAILSITIAIIIFSTTNNNIYNEELIAQETNYEKHIFSKNYFEDNIDVDKEEDIFENPLMVYEDE